MFKNFSKFQYFLNGQTLEYTDIFKSIKVNTDNFTDINIVKNYSKERPDQLSNTIYNDHTLYWSLFLLNNVRNPFKQWNQTPESLIDQNAEEYKAWYFQFANNSSYLPTNPDYYETNALDSYLGVTLSGIEENDILIYDTGDTSLKFKVLGAGSIGSTLSCAYPNFGQSIIPDNFVNRNQIQSYSAGGNFTATTDSNGRIWGWGENIGLTKNGFELSGSLYKSPNTNNYLINTTKNKIIASQGASWNCYGIGCTASGSAGLVYPKIIANFQFETIAKVNFTKGNTFAGLILDTANSIEIYGGLTATIGITALNISGTTFEDITCVENCCFGLIRNGTCYDGSVIEFNYSGQTCGYKPNILPHHICLQVDARLAETTSVDKNLYTFQGHTFGVNGTYTRNTAHWLTTKRNASLGITGVDLTCISPWNSTQCSRLTNYNARWGYFNAGTAISPLHFVTSQHYENSEGGQGFQVGDTIRFVAKDNTVIVRTVVAVIDDTVVTGSDISKDIQICLMDSALPTTITPAKVLGPDCYDYFPPYFTTRGDVYLDSFRIPQVYTDQEEKILIYDSVSFKDGIVPIDPNRLNYFELTQQGDSSSPIFFIINNQLVLLTVRTTGMGGDGFIGGVNTDLINEMMTRLGGGYTLSTIDLSEFTKYPNYNLNTTKQIAGGVYNLLTLDEDGNVAGFGDNSKNQLNLPNAIYKTISCGMYHSAGIDSYNNLQVAGQIQTESGDCDGVTAYVNLQSLPGEFASISSGYHHLAAFGGGDSGRHIGRVFKVDDKLKRIEVLNYDAPDSKPVLIDEPSGTVVSVWRDDVMVKTIQHQLNSIDSYLNTTQYVKNTEGQILNLAANDGQLWKSTFITGYKQHATNALFITPLKIQSEVISNQNNIKFITNNKVYLLEKALNNAVSTTNKIEIKMSEL